MGDEFMGKLALPATLLGLYQWRRDSASDHPQAHTPSWSCRHPVVLAGEEQEVDAAPWERKRAKQAKLWAAVMEKRARAHAQAKAKATVSVVCHICDCLGQVLHAWCVCALWRYMRAARFLHATVACAARILCTGLGAAKNALPLPPPSSLASLARASFVKSPMLRAEARGRKQPAPQIFAMRAFVRVKFLGRPSSKSVRDPDEGANVAFVLARTPFA